MGRKEERRKGDGKRGRMKGRREGRRKGEKERIERMHLKDIAKSLGLDWVKISPVVSYACERTLQRHLRSRQKKCIYTKTQANEEK